MDSRWLLTPFVSLQTLDQEALQATQLLLLSTFKYKYHNSILRVGLKFLLVLFVVVQVMP